MDFLGAILLVVSAVALTAYLLMVEQPRRSSAQRRHRKR
jgi:hypothetical protein